MNHMARPMPVAAAKVWIQEKGHAQSQNLFASESDRSNQEWLYNKKNSLSQQTVSTEIDEDCSQ